MLNKNKVALSLATFSALLHAVWSLVIALFPGGVQSLAGWVLEHHFLSSSTTLLPFDLGSAVLLVLYSFIMAYIVGWVFAAIYNWWAR